ncbi:putative alpha-L-arabinofuranosidase C [Exophiala dermatitidis]|uniref:non-reducing end alpha-L-arabinofuranosidase n=1 Tax=Exophiala dermatitidis (strain ATCC 34100 / CBS 525.76 / NIH/UT8656) TaxID=858893 RepID=H6C319_EXODN|nr:alpha-N-arabinofuranosidase C [Exophiala dermatitidis NIH/UT8656]EHY58034.1 alpha-N-arabinofuranosidase C [Exophiala dermatitidis NIH/UT8656]
MTTITSNSTSSPSITIFPSHKVSRINRNIYAGFTEHMGRCIYGGIYDPGNTNTNLIDSHGFRKDVLEALAPLEIPVFRYPGGNFCATYHWQDGIGPVKSRPARPELAWGNIETNHFGTDEFMQWCKAANTEPYLCLNFGTGTLDEAMAWVEYCNGTKDTYYANLRRQNGHPEPYNVKYWALGNEMWGPWQIEQMTQEAYAEKALQWAKALKLLDPSIELILCGKEGATSWDYYTLKHCLQPAGLSDLGEERLPLIDMHSIHLYTASEDHYENVTAPLAAERSIEVCSGLIDLAIVENKIPASQKRPTICFDEWNVWSPPRAPGSKGAEEKYTLSDALAVAVWLNVLVRKSRDVGMACIAQSVNVISPLMTTETGIIRQTIWWPYELFCRFMKGHTVAVHLACDSYTGSTKPDWVRAVKETPWLDVSATVDDDGWVSVCVVNMHLEVDFKTAIGGPNGQKVTVYTVTGSNPQATNMAGKEEVGLKRSEWDSEKDQSFVFPKCSITMLRWKSQ